MDSSLSLKRAENALRDFISSTLKSEFGTDWINECGVKKDRIDLWRARREEENKKHHDRNIETRLLYYSDFYDLWTIIDNHWEHIFLNVFRKHKTMEVFFDELKKYRNMEAHHRELLPHQKNLVFGISEEIRNNIIRYRSMKEEKSSEDYYPRIERVSDSIGNVWVPGKGGVTNVIDTKCKLKVGDSITFQIAATDPYGGKLSYGIKTVGGSGLSEWNESDVIEYEVQNGDIGLRFMIKILIISNRDYHAHTGYDDRVQFMYQVLPPYK